MIVVGDRAASRIATALFPAAVGPQMTRTGSASSEATLNLVPRELHDRRSAVDVVCGQGRVAKCDKQRAHLAWRERITRFDRGFAGNGRGQTFMLRVRPRVAIARQCR